jgi:hypothetical protein
VCDARVDSDSIFGFSVGWKEQSVFDDGTSTSRVETRGAKENITKDENKDKQTMRRVYLLQRKSTVVPNDTRTTHAVRSGRFNAIQSNPINNR